jgi:hypothetical protein
MAPMSPEPSISTLRVALRAGNCFILDLLNLHRGKRDFTDALILATLVQSNSAAVAGDADLQRRYATLDSPIPQPVRRAISVNAVAASLGLPFETVRRRTKKLIDAGFCEATGQGVRVSDASMRSTAHREALDACYLLVRQLHQRLRHAGCLASMDLPPQAEPFPGPAPPVRIVWRAGADYFLRMMEVLLPHFPNLIRPFVVLEVVRANTAGFSDAMRGEDGLDPEAFMPDDHRRPVRASDVAISLGLPHETVRRHLLVEEAEGGRCVRVRGGFIVPAAVLARSNVLAGWTANFRYLSRMFAELAETGVLARWEAEAQASGDVARAGRSQADTGQG